ncbi:MAG: helix-turn-helix transcriptional regulator [Oscillospiraceae bacterium]|nr:helix-turn-helix transcriptional regulator [Oscillospiraceae bacterium]
MKYQSIGRNIRKYRMERKFKQDELAEKSGLSSNYIGMVERGEKIPSLESFINILNSLDVSADMILCDELSCGYRMKNTLLHERIAQLSQKDQQTVYSVIETLLENL